MSRAGVGAVVLAAGGSARMGRPKVLLEIEGEALVRRVVRLAAEADLAPIVVVAGTELSAIRQAVAGTDALVIENRGWREGMAGSIRCGVMSLAAAEAGGALLLLADQPFITSDHLRDLVAAFRRGDDPVATRYGEARGVPALFGSRWFAELGALSGDRGAQELLDRAGAAAIGDGVAPVDIDTVADLERHLRR